MKRDISPLQQLANIESSYSSDDFEDDRMGLVREFFVPCLKNSMMYSRLSAFYNSEVLIYVLQGIKELVKKKGKIRLLLGCIPSKEFNVVNDKDRKKFYEEDFVKTLLKLDEFPDLERSEAKKSAIQLFAWLLHNNILEIKLGFLINEENKFASRKEILVSLTEGMLHDKLGIFTDEMGEMIGFRGSLNETVKGLTRHEEGIDVHKSWQVFPELTKNEHLSIYILRFEKLWNNQSKRLKVFSLPSEMISRIKAKIPEIYGNKDISHDFEIIDNLYRTIEQDLPDINTLAYKIKPIGKVHWKSPQLEGYERWMQNKRKGILSIATGVGKTLIGLRAIYDFLETAAVDKTKIVVIAVHNSMMINQWREEIQKWLFSDNGKNQDIFMIDIKGGKRRLTIEEQIANLNVFGIPFNNKIIIISRYDIYAELLIPSFEKNIKGREILFIADEVHEMGTEIRIKSFSAFNPNFLLGLSATPEKYWDTIGATKFLNQYFEGEKFPKGIIYEYSIGDAIRDGYLCPYDYYPVKCELTKKENEKYIKLSKAIAVAEEEDPRDEEKIKQFSMIRKRILKIAFSKESSLDEIMHKIKDESDLVGISFLLIYLEDTRQLLRIETSLKDRGIKTKHIVSKTEDREREEIIEDFKIGNIPVLLAIRILDQGINIPELRYAIITSSTGNKKQFIQRRGRLLRINKETGKRKAVIYDLVVPYYTKNNKKEPIKSELDRVQIFSEDCENKKIVEEIKKKW